MYSEKKFKNYIFWVKVRRLFLLILFSVLGCLIGIFASDLINTLAANNTYRVLIISISTLSFFAFTYLITIGTAKEVQDGYWKIAVLRKLTVISKKLDVLQDDESKELISELNENLDLEPVKQKALNKYKRVNSNKKSTSLN